MAQKKTKKDAPKEDLARMVANGFSSMEKRFVGLENSMEKRFDQMDQKFEDMISGLDNKLSDRITDLDEKLSGKIDGLNNRIDDLALNRATREEMKLLSFRVENIEQKVGIKTK